RCARGAARRLTSRGSLGGSRADPRRPTGERHVLVRQTTKDLGRLTRSLDRVGDERVLEEHREEGTDVARGQADVERGGGDGEADVRFHFLEVVDRCDDRLHGFPERKLVPPPPPYALAKRDDSFVAGTKRNAESPHEAVLLQISCHRAAESLSVGQ